MPRRFMLPDDGPGRWFGTLGVCLVAYYGVSFLHEFSREWPRERARETGRRELAAATTVEARDTLLRRTVPPGTPVRTATERLQALGLLCTTAGGAAPRSAASCTSNSGFISVTEDDARRGDTIASPPASYLQVLLMGDSTGRVTDVLWATRRAPTFVVTATGTQPVPLDEAVEYRRITRR